MIDLLKDKVFIIEKTVDNIQDRLADLELHMEKILHQNQRGGNLEI